MRLRRETGWLLATLAGLVVLTALAFRAVHPTYDLAYFLPAPVTGQQRVLVERLGQGAGARLVFAEVTTRGTADATGVAARMKALLAASPLFLRVEDGQRELSPDAIPGTLWRLRYLLADVDWSEAGLRAALAERAADLLAVGGPEVAQLVAADPVWSAPRVLERLQIGGEAAQPRWAEGTTRAFLVAETAAAPFDTGGQQDAIDALRAAHREAAGGDEGLELYGVGVYGARVQSVIQSETQLLGLLASVVVLGIIVAVYRSVRLALVSVLPLATAVLGGLAVAGALFGRIHGITIAFGATLLGVVDDYPMHLFSHARHETAAGSVRLLWRTLLASAGTAIIAYAAMAVSGSRGLAQLGVFSLAGILCAMAVTCWVLPRLMPPAATTAPHDGEPQEFALSVRAWLPLLVVSLVALWTGGGVRWNDNLGEMTPVPPALLTRDRAMRERFAAPDVRYLVSVAADSEEEALRRTERLDAALGDARRAGLLAGWSAVTTVVPSLEAQARRRAAIPDDATLAARLAAAGRDLPFRADAFAPFLAAAAATRNLPPLHAADVTDAFLGDFVAGHLGRTGDQAPDQWRSVLFLTGLASPDSLRTWLAAHGEGAELVDLKAASESLMAGYRQHLLGILGGALLLIAGLVYLATRDAQRFAWSLLTVAASVAFTLAVVARLHGSVSLFHLVAVVLVAGLGVDYCLFYSRPDVTRTEFRDTRHAIAACSTTTVAAFGILGLSSIPVLSILGTTVAIGTLTMLLASRAGCRAL